MMSERNNMPAMQALLAKYLGGDDDSGSNCRSVTIKHGGEGGKFYCVVENEHGDVIGDGVGETLDEAMVEAIQESDMAEIVDPTP